MTSKKDVTEKEMTAPKPSAKRKRSAPASPPTAAQKAEAVLAIWTDRVKTAEVMRVMGVPYVTLQQWQERAMEGMLQALEPRTNLANGAALSPRLQALLAKRQQAAGADRLKARLDRLSEVAPEPAVPSNG